MAKRGTLGLRLVVIAMAGIALLASRPAWAQYYVGTDGRSDEANNRLGSNGSNGAEPTGPNNNVPTAQQRLYGNVTGLGAFRGFVPFRAPGAFTGGIPIGPGEALRQVAGNANDAAAPPTYNQPQLWYVPQLASSAPDNFEEVPGTGGAVVAPTPQYREPGDYRLGATLDLPPNAYPSPDQAVGGGAPVDMSAIALPSNLINAPVYGAHQLIQTPLGNAYTDVSTNYTPTASQLVNGGLLSSNLSQADVYRLRNELTASSVGFANSTSATLAANATASPNGPTAPAANANSTASANSSVVTAQPIQAMIASQAVSATNLSASPLPSSLGSTSTGQRTRHQLVPLPPPATYSPQYARLRQLLNQYDAAHPKTDEEANRLFLQALQARREYEQSVATGMPNPPSALPGLPASPVAPGPAANQAPPPSALDFGPIAPSIHASGLRQLVQEGEDLARHQHYTDAIQKFINAREVDPNFMLINIDLANAELGAGFYAEAEQYLRQAFQADPALLMGKYDITSVIGPDRIDILVNDLKQLASSSDSPTPLFLLAYISYNTGNSSDALQYLQLAQNRAGGQDEIIKELGDHWALPQQQPTQTPATQPSGGK
ncbi:MAG TPA: hypothetical protein VL992_11415 [Tepidisphaeraceae bacterium]|nr:hypothetical protein [Tepidisphaeraceae bacterium]